MSPITLPIPIVHYLFEWAGLATGLFVYRSIRRRRGDPGLTTPGTFAVIVSGLLGAAVGNKLAFWAEAPPLWASHATVLGTWLTGQSIVGALLGGWIGVEIGKRISGISIRTGDDYVPPILAGLVIDEQIGWWLTLAYCVVKTISAIWACPVYRLYACMKGGNCCTFLKRKA